jgi:hypothetical protein
VGPNKQLAGSAGTAITRGRTSWSPLRARLSTSKRTNSFTCLSAQSTFRALTEENAATSPNVVDHVNYAWLCVCGHICSGHSRTTFGMTGSRNLPLSACRRQYRSVRSRSALSPLRAGGELRAAATAGLRSWAEQLPFAVGPKY